MTLGLDTALPFPGRITSHMAAAALATARPAKTEIVDPLRHFSVICHVVTLKNAAPGLSIHPVTAVELLETKAWGFAS